MTIIIAHKPARVVRFEVFDDDDLAGALGRLAELRWSDASQLVAYDAELLTDEYVGWRPLSGGAT